jgi:DNA-directed RNA polymerase specialized sigma24 family protein
MSSEQSPSLCELLADGHWVRLLARQLAANVHDADDLAQDACLLALRHPLRHEHNPRGWFQRVLVNLVRQQARAQQRRHRREQELAPHAPEGAPTLDLVERAATHRRLVDACFGRAAGPTCPARPCRARCPAASRAVSRPCP